MNKVKLSAIFRVFLATMVFCIIVVFLFDTRFNGLIPDWFVKNFVWQQSSLEDGYINSGIYWPKLKNFLIFFFFLFSVALVCVVWFACAAYGKYKSRETVSRLTAEIQSYLEDSSADLDVFSQEFLSVSLLISRLRSRAAEKEKLLEQETSRKNDLITYLAHDLKTPLASVIGYLCLLTENPDLPGPLKEKYTEIALDKTYRLEQLINEFFEITRYSLHSIVVNPEKIHLKTMLLQIADEFYPILEADGKTISVDAPADLILVGDADKLARVFNNILKNAAAYSYEHTQIHIRAYQREGWTIITFVNQGTPIPPHQLETIFEKFYRLDTARSSKTGGSGLGLAIAKEIVTAHHGTILAASDAENTVFTIRLPNPPQPVQPS